MMRRLLIIVALAVLANTAWAQDNPARVTVQQRLEKTAVFPGDRVDYRVEIRCAPGTDILAGDMDADELTLNGLEVVSSRRERRATTAGIIYEFNYRLTSYETGAAPLQIGEQVLRYYARRPGLSPDDAVASGEVVIPAVRLALRSTLPDAEVTSLALRDGRAATLLAGGIAWLRPAGLVLILIAALPLLLWAGPYLRRRVVASRQRPAAGPDPRLLESLDAVDAADAAARRGAYDQLEALLRQRLAAAGIPAFSLTAAETVDGLGIVALPVATQELAAVLAECEQARYGRDQHLPPAERFRAGVALARRLLDVR